MQMVFLGPVIFYLDGWQSAGHLLRASLKMPSVGILNNKQQQ